MAKLSLVGHTPPLPEVVETQKPDWTPAVVKLQFGEIFANLYSSEKKLFDGVNNETSVFGIVSMDHAYLVEHAILLYQEKNKGAIIDKKDYAKIGRGLNLWMKDAKMSRHARRELAKQAAIAALNAPMQAA